MSRASNTPPAVEGYPFAFANPFSEYTGFQAPTSPRPFVPLSYRPVSSDIVHPDPPVKQTHSLDFDFDFDSLPGNVANKPSPRRCDEIERLYRCSWTGCTNGYATLSALNAHIVMQRHGNKRTRAGEIHSSSQLKYRNRLIVGVLEQNLRSSGNSGAMPRRVDRNAWRRQNTLGTWARN